MDQPLSVKGLRLLTFSITLIFILIMGSLAYSGYQELTYLAQSLNQESLQKAISTNSTHLTISGLEIENRGLYSLRMGFEGELSLDEEALSSSKVGPLIIPPGGKTGIDASMPLPIDTLLRKPNLMKKLLFNKTMAKIRFKVDAGMEPFVMASISGSFNDTFGPVLGDLRLGFGEPSLHNASHISLPLTLEFVNKSPLPFLANLSLRMVSTPKKQEPGSYGYGSATLSILPNQPHRESLTIYVQTDTLERGTYTIEALLSSKDFSHGWTFNVEG